MNAAGIRQAYLDLAGPLPQSFIAGAVDLRPGVPMDRKAQTAVIVCGADDLVELRGAVERVTGPMTWPLRSARESTRIDADTFTRRLSINRPAQLMALVVALGDELRDNSAAWRTRKTMLETLGTSLNAVDVVTVVAHRCEPA